MGTSLTVNFCHCQVKQPQTPYSASGEKSQRPGMLFRPNLSMSDQHKTGKQMNDNGGCLQKSIRSSIRWFYGVLSVKRPYRSGHLINKSSRNIKRPEPGAFSSFE